MSLIMALITISAIITSSFITVSAETTKDVSYVEFQADNYKRLFNMDPQASAAYNFYQELKGDKKLQGTITAWEVMHIVDAPSHANKSGLIYKGDFYTIALFDMLDASREDSVMSYMLDSLYSDKEAAVYELASEFSEMLKTPVDQLDLINIYDFKKGIKDFKIKEFVGGYKSEFESSFSGSVPAIDITVDLMSSASEIIETIASYRAIANMRNGVLEVLAAIVNDTTNEKALRDAARNCLPLLHNSYNNILNDIAKGALVFTGVTIKTVAGIVLDSAWNVFVASVPVLRELGLSVKGFRILMNATFDFDERISIYYKLEAAVKIERAVSKIVETNKTVFDKNKNEKTASMYMESIWFYQKALLQGAEYFAEYMEHHLESIGNQLYYWIIGQYDDMKNAIANVKNFRINRARSYLSFETNVRSLYISNVKNYDSVLNDFKNQDKIGSTSNTTTTPTTGYTSAPSITQSEVEQKINKLVSLLDGKYFTTTQKSCGNNSCDLCYNENVFASSWFKNMFGTVSANQIPGHAYPNGSSGTPQGWTCHGFANFAMWYIFSSNNSNAVKYKRIVDNVKLTKENLQKYAKPGDVIRFSNHTVVLISINENDFTVLDCNAQLNGDGYARVRKHTYSYSGRGNYTMAISRATNYDTTSSVPSYTLTVNYNANGGSVPASQTIGEVYTIVPNIGLNVRSKTDPNDDTVIIGALGKGNAVVVTEKTNANGYTWGKILYKGVNAWIAIGSGLATKTGTTYSQSYCVNNSLIYKSSTSSAYGKMYTYGGVADDLDDDTVFGLYRDGYTFKGWSLSATGGALIDKDKALKAEDLSPSAANKTITVYAVWEENVPEVTDRTVEKIYLSSIPKKDVYYIGDEIDKSSISIIVEHTDGSFESVNSGFVCTPSAVLSEGRQKITVTYEGKTAEFEITATQSKTRANNATSKVASTGYLLPSSSSGTIFNTGGTYAGDVMQVLCRDGDYYLCLFPWNGTTTTKENNVLLYFKASDIVANSTVPTAAEYFSLNPTGKENAVVLTDTVAHYRPDGGATPVKYNGVAAPQNSVSKDARVKVLFEMDGYYCIRTDKFTGFVAKNTVKLDTFAYTLDVNVTDAKLSEGEKIDTSAIKVSEKMTDGTAVETSLEKCTVVLPSTDTSGQKHIVITCNDLSALIPVTVNEVKVNKLVIEKMPTKLAYVVGESFEPAGISVKAELEGGKLEDVTAKVTYDAVFNEEGNVTVGVKYGSNYAYIPVKVYEKPEIEILNTDGYAGEKITVPVHYFAGSEVVVPSSFEITVSYDASKLSYLGVENGTKFTVTNVDGDTLRIKFNGAEAILNNILATLEFKLMEDASCYNTSAKVTIDKLDLTDSLGNKFESVLTGGEVFNLGIEKTDTDTDTEETNAPQPDSDSEETKEEAQTGTVKINYSITGCNSSLLDGGAIIAIAILTTACVAFVTKKKED